MPNQWWLVSSQEDHLFVRFVLKNTVSVSVLRAAVKDRPEVMAVVIKDWQQYREVHRRDPSRISRRILADAVGWLKAIGVLVPVPSGGKKPSSRLMYNPTLGEVLSEYCEAEEQAKLAASAATKKRSLSRPTLNVLVSHGLPPMREEAPTQEVDLAGLGACLDPTVVQTYRRAAQAEAAATE